tara:strand:- start:97 stop:810 length:714 start_codon:yes stop_codon:yes gene_type:complete
MSIKKANILFIQPHGNKKSDLKWVKELEKEHIVSYIGFEKYDGDNLALKQMGLYVYEQWKSEHYDVVICTSRGGQVLYSAINEAIRENTLWNTPCIVVNGFSTGYEPVSSIYFTGPIILVTCGCDIFLTKDTAYTMEHKFSSIYSYPLLLYHDNESKHRWDDDHNHIKCILFYALELTNYPNQFPDILVLDNLWYKAKNTNTWVDKNGQVVHKYESRVSIHTSIFGELLKTINKDMI